MNRDYVKWYSERLGRPMEALVFGTGGEPVIFFPTSRGRFYQYEDFGVTEVLRAKVEAGRYLLVCADGVDEESWYDKRVPPAARVRRHEQYEAYILHELVPFARHRSSGGRLTLTGASFGAFHTMQIGLRHPAVFDRLVALSGAYETESFLDGHHDELTYFHSVFQWLPNLGDPAILERMYRQEIILAAGGRDICRASTERLSGMLWQKGVGNHLSIWGDHVHDWPVWREMYQTYLPW